MAEKYTADILEKLSSQMPLPFIVEDYNNASFEIIQAASRKERDKMLMHHKLTKEEIINKVEVEELHESSGLLSKTISVNVDEDYSVVATEKIRSNFGKKRYIEWLNLKEANYRYQAYEFLNDVGDIRSDFISSINDLTKEELIERLIQEQDAKNNALLNFATECVTEIHNSVEYTKYWETHPVLNNK